MAVIHSTHTVQDNSFIFHLRMNAAPVCQTASRLIIGWIFHWKPISESGLIKKYRIKFRWKVTAGWALGTHRSLSDECQSEQQQKIPSAKTQTILHFMLNITRLLIFPFKAYTKWQRSVRHRFYGGVPSCASAERPLSCWFYSSCDNK